MTRMKPVQTINRELLDNVSMQARTAPRRRKNHNFHAAENDPCNRLLNAIEPDSYIQPHCHRDASKDETIIIVRGRVGMVFFDDRGAVTSTTVLAPASEAVGVNVPHGVYHTLVALESNSVFFEAKAGPYAPLIPEEKAAWAPVEGDPRAATYLAGLKHLFV